MEKSKKNKDEKTIPELKMELERARRMEAMIKAIGEKALELQSENELLKERLAAMSPEGGAPVTTEPGKDGHKSLTPGTTFECLAVTQVQVFPFKDSEILGKIKAMASVVLNDQLQVQGLRVIDGQYGLFVVYPADPFFKGEGTRYVCAPITRQLREHIENCVLEKYQQVVG